VNKQIIIKTCSTLRKCWVIHEKSLLHSAIIFMSLLAVVRLIYEFHRLVFVSDGAIDLRLRYDEFSNGSLGCRYTVTMKRLFIPLHPIFFCGHFSNPFPGPWSVGCGH
jgi:hypothetical protein